MKLALSATVHCLIGCGVGEVLGMVISNYYSLPMMKSMVLSVVLGFILGFALGIVPLLKRKFSLAKAFKIVLISEGLSIAVMEAFEVFT